MDGPRGALIADLDPEGPASRDGLRVGDVILEVDGEEVERSSTLPRLIGRVVPGNDVELTLMRDGERTTETVTIADWPETHERAERPDAPSGHERLGMTVAELEAADRERLGIEYGVRVREVQSQGPAAEAGIRPGDIIVSIDHQRVENPAELAELAGTLDGQRALPVRLYRDGRSLFVALRLAE